MPGMMPYAYIRALGRWRQVNHWHLLASPLPTWWVQDQWVGLSEEKNKTKQCSQHLLKYKLCWSSCFSIYLCKCEHTHTHANSLVYVGMHTNTGTYTQIKTDIGIHTYRQTERSISTRLSYVIAQLWPKDLYTHLCLNILLGNWLSHWESSLAECMVM